VDARLTRHLKTFVTFFVQGAQLIGWQRWKAQISLNKIFEMTFNISAQNNVDFPPISLKF
jgi:hypothetical protein